MKKLTLILMGLTLMAMTSISDVAHAEAPHPVELGSILGSGIDLKMHDHAFAGAVRSFVAWGYVDEETFTSELIVRKDGQLIRANFKKQDDGRIGGTVGTTPIFTKKVIPAERKIIFDFNGTEAVATFQPESMNKDHLVNPTVTLTFGEQQITYRMVGEGCYGYLMFNTMMILTAYTL